jgi:two-component system LytT family response regulator
LTGFEVLQQIEGRKFQLIFQTAYDEYAIKAFEENACDYLLKPFTKERMATTLKKAFNLIAQNEALSRLENKLQKSNLDKIAVKQGGKLKIVPIKEIECFVSRDHYTCIYQGNTEFIIDLSLNWFEERLDPNIFIRCHRNSIVAIDKIKTLSESSNSEVEMHNGMKLPVSRNNKKQLSAVIKTLAI